MSLRDQLLAKGLVDAKRAREVTRDLKRQRKAEQGNKQRKAALRRAEEEAKRARDEAERERLLTERREREQARDQYERALQIRNVLLGHRLQHRGDHPFWFIGHDRRTIHRIGVHRKVAEQLADGALAIGWLDHGVREEYLLLGAAGARRLEELDALDVVVHWSRGARDPVTEALLTRDWEPSLRPHRVRA